MKKRAHTFRFSQMIILLAGLLAVTGSNVGYSQTCCLTNSLVINTGYDPASASIMTLGAVDPKWTVSALSPDCAAIPGASTTAAYDITPSGVWPTIPGGTPSTYISFVNSDVYFGSSTATYWMTLSRCFHLCYDADVTFNMNIWCDDWVSDLNVDGTTALGSPTFPEATICGSGLTTPAPNATNTVHLLAGDHCINVTVFNCAGTAFLGHGLDVIGTVSTSSNVLRSESSSCGSSWTYCSEPAISGDNTCCRGDSKTLSNSFTGGTWSSSDASIASIVSATGVYTGVSAGTATMTYTDLCGRTTATYPVTVNPDPTITSGYGVCLGYTTTLTATPSGGTWSGGSGDATVSGVGVVTGISLGSAPFTYTLSTTGCSVTGTESVDPLPSPITGTFTVCAGFTSVIGDAGGGTGTWSVSNANAVIEPGPNLGGITAGTATITYTTAATGCFITQSVTVNPVPAAITGPSAVCGGSTITLSDGSTGGTWTSSNTSNAPIGSATGIVTGILTGTFPDVATITYTLPTGCTTTTTVTIDALPYGITGTTTVCIGATTTLSDGVGGGTWSAGAGSGSISVGSATGMVTGITAGTATVTYTSSAGCSVTTGVTVNPSPAPITGVFGVCLGFSTPLTDATPGGNWSTGSGNVTVGSGTGLVAGITTGTATVTYTLALDGCMIEATVTVNPNPKAINGIMRTCTRFTTSLTDSTTGGNWSSGDTAIATVDAATGVVTGADTGTVTITYTLPTGCVATTTVTVYGSPGIITGDTVFCSGTSVTLSASPGGTWSIADGTIATIGSATGFVTGLVPGNTLVTCTNTYGCAVTQEIYVGVLPITGAYNMCAGGSSEVVADATPGGTWTSAVVTMLMPGTAMTELAGVATIYYTLPGCFATATLTVNPLPEPITGDLLICGIGATTTLSTLSTGGVWSASAGSGSVTVGSATGIVTGVTAGTAEVTYTFPTGCTQTKTVTVNATISAISGTGAVCVGATTTLSATPGSGTWSSSNTAIATVGSTSGIVTGVAAGNATITYSLAGCSVTETVTINSLPSLITGDTIVCQGTGATLTDSIAGGHWTSSHGTVAAIGSGTGIVITDSAGTATITYTLASTGCAIAVIFTVNDTTGNCTPCEIFTHRAYTALGPSISTGTLSGYYYLPNNATISGTVNVTDAVVLVAAGVTVSVNPTASLLINGSHLLGGCGMWNGIVLLNDGVNHTARLTVQADGSGVSSLIEDAATVATLITTYGSATDFVKCDNAIFNRNNIGLDIENDTSLSASLPFLIRNTVFTSRDFSGYAGYPYAWPQTLGAGGLKTLVTPASVFYPPYNINTAYSGANLKNGYEAYAGIKLNNIGWYTAPSHLTGPPIPSFYSEIVIGDTTQTTGDQYLNVFDNLNYGINGNNSNITSVNNAFLNMRVNSAFFGPSFGGDGLYASSTPGYNYNRLRVYSPNGNPYHNQFYNFSNGVECYNYFQLIGQYNFMINSGTGTFTLPAALYGYVVKSSQFDTINISMDTISNSGTGIAVWATYAALSALPAGSVSQYAGLCKVDSNVIQASPLGYVPDMTQSLNLAISVQNTLTTSSLGGLNWSDVSGNYLNDVANGIFINNFTHGLMNTNYNTITLRPYTTHRLFYGINHTLCQGSGMHDNLVNASYGTTGNDSMRAYYLQSTMAAGVSCNAADNTGRGYEFFLQNHGASWHHNSMTNNLKGYVLNGAVIGTQHFGGHPIDNIWVGGTWSSSKSQTYVYHGANATQDTIYVTSAPTYNTGDSSFPLRDYTSGTSIQIQPTDYPSPCPVVNYNHDFLQGERIAQKRIIYTDNVIPNNWTAQFEVWKSIVADYSIEDSDAVIAQFGSMAMNSRYKYLTDLDSIIATGDYADATVMLGYNIDSMANTEIDTTQDVQMADDTTADYIVENYQSFYRLYMAYMDSSLASPDSLQIMALAQMCPEINGNVVYQARALYSNIYNDLSVFNDDSCLDLDTGYIASRHSAPPPKGEGGITQGVQQYKIFPNPNDGSFEIQQYIPDNEPVNAEIEDVLGRNVYKQTLLFTLAKSALNLNNITPGVYLLKLKDSSSKSFMFKFVVQ